MLANYYHIRYATSSAPSLNNKMESGNWLFHKIHLHARNSSLNVSSMHIQIRHPRVMFRGREREREIRTYTDQRTIRVVSSTNK